MATRSSAPLLLRHLGTPTAVPPAGSLYLYAKSDNKLYLRNSASVETPVDATGGSSTTNFAVCKAATTANITLSGAQTVDGVSVVVGDTVLVKNQTVAANNGVYTVSATGWTRFVGFDTSAGVAAGVVVVLAGTQGGTDWTTTFKSTDTINTTSMNWYQILNGSMLGAAGGAEPTLAAASGTPSLQYYRGDKTWQTLNLAALPDAWVKRSVRVASTANVVIATGGLQTVDGITLAANDRVLLKNQTTASENGIYQVNAGAWTRATDANTSAMMAGADVAVDSGTQGGFLYSNLFKVTDTLGTTAMNWYRVLDSSLIGAAGGVLGTPTGTKDGTKFLRDDGTWAAPPAGTLVGTMSMWPTNTPPQDHLIADGTVLSQAAWPDLYAIIGTTYNIGGEAAGTFRLPNLVGRVPVGRDALQIEFDVLGETGGEKTHLLTIAEMPAHGHPINFTGQTFTTAGAGGYVASANGAGGQGGPTGQWSYSIGNTGGGAAHNVLQPYTVVNYIIKAQNSAGQTTPTGGWWVPTGGTTGQYLRKNSAANGDSAWSTPTKTDVGLDQVDNTSDVNKPVSTATQNALNAKADTSAMNTGDTNATNNAVGTVQGQGRRGKVDVVVSTINTNTTKPIVWTSAMGTIPTVVLGLYVASAANRSCAASGASATGFTAAAYSGTTGTISTNYVADGCFVGQSF